VVTSPVTQRFEAADHYLYRAFAADGQLLYVGRSLNVESRFSTHRNSSPWHPNMTHHTVEGPYSYADIQRVEREAVRQEDPLWNVDGSRRSRIKHAQQLVENALDVEGVRLGWNIIDMSEIRGPAWRFTGIGRFANLEPNYENVGAAEYLAGLVVESPEEWIRMALRQLERSGWEPYRRPDVFTITNGRNEYARYAEVLT